MASSLQLFTRGAKLLFVALDGVFGMSARNGKPDRDRQQNDRKNQQYFGPPFFHRLNLFRRMVVVILHFRGRGRLGPDPIQRAQPIKCFVIGAGSHVAAAILAVLTNGIKQERAIRIRVIAERFAIDRITRRFG